MENEKKKYYEDDYWKWFVKEDQFTKFIKEREADTQWKREKTKNLRIKAILNDDVTLSLGNGSKGPLTAMIERDNSESVDKLLSDNVSNKDIVLDTLYNTALLLETSDGRHLVRNCALSTILDRAGIRGNGLAKVCKPVFAHIVNECLKTAQGEALYKISAGKVSTVHGGGQYGYSILNIPQLFDITIDYLNNNYYGTEFLNGSFEHTLVSAAWILPQNELLFETYRREIEKVGKASTMLKAELKMTTSDTGDSAVKLYPILLAGDLNITTPIGAPLKLLHKHNATIKDYQERLKGIFAQYKKALKGLEGLLHIEIQYPINAMAGIMKKVGIPKKYAMKAIEKFKLINGDNLCTAHDIYYAITEVIFLAQMDEEIPCKILDLEEKVARVLTIKWHDFDFPGDQQIKKVANW